MDRDPPPVTVTASGSQAALPDVPDGAPERSVRIRPPVVVVDCSIEPQARRDLVLFVSTCRRPRG